MVSRRALIATSLLLFALLWTNACLLARALGGVPEKGSLEKVWTVPVASVSTIVRTRVEAKGPELLVLIGAGGVSEVAGDGSIVRRAAVDSVVTGATGDVNGDGGDDIVVGRRSGVVQVLAGDTLRVLWSATLPESRAPARLLPVDLDGDGRREIIAGDALGRLHAFSSTGRLLWSTPAPPQSGEMAEIRGLDDVKLGTERKIAVAWRYGMLKLLDAAGKQAWELATDRIRRMRAFDVTGDGRSEILFGCDSGGYTVQDAAGNRVLSWGLGEAVVEIRALEIDGDPRQPEVAIGGKNGTFRFMSGTRVLVEGNAGARVSEIGGVDTNGDGRDEVFVGTDTGGLNAFAANGWTLGTQSLGGRIDAIVGVVSPLRDRLVVVSGPNGVSAFRSMRTRAPAWYSPVSAAALGSLVLLVCALALAGLQRPAPPAPPPVAESAPAAVRALVERLGQLEALVAAGHLTGDAAADRVQQLKAQIARAQQAATRAPQQTSPPPPPKVP
jgi:hypothetical protein